MSRYVSIVLCLLLFACSGCALTRTSISPQADLIPAEVPASFDHAELNAVLARFATESGRVDYAALKEDSADLDRYYAKVAAFSPDSHPDLFPTRNERIAYWINAYNAAVMVTVLRYYPIKSVGDVQAPLLLRWFPDKSGFFYFQGPEFGGDEINLYDLENSLIRPRYPDARIHFALNRASIGCPRLPTTAFSAEDLDAELDRESRKFCGEERNVRIDDGAKRIVLSAIFDWYTDDFVQHENRRSGREDGEVLDFIARYLSPERVTHLQRVRKEYEIVYAPYDWGLNDTATAGGAHP